MSYKIEYYNCFLDLYRAAASFYLNPKGKNHQVFMRHALEILKGLKEKKAKKFFLRLKKLKKKTSVPIEDKRDVSRLADEILTLGILLKD